MDRVILVIRWWMRFEELEYYRVRLESKELSSSEAVICFFDLADREGVYWDRRFGDEAIDLEGLTPAPADWDAVVNCLRPPSTESSAAG